MGGLESVQLHLVDSVDDAAALMRWLGERRDVLAVDSETEGLDWWKDRVRLIQVGDAEDGWAIPWDLWGGVALEAIRRYDGPIVMHNASFDVHMIEHWTGTQLDRSRIEDTRVMSHILDPTRVTGLKSLAAYHVDRQAAQASQALDDFMAANGYTWATVPITAEPYWLYGALDTVLTARLWQVLKPRVQADAPRAFDLEMASVWVTNAMETNGCRVDLEYTRRKRDEFAAYCERADEWCRTNFGVRAGSDVEVLRRLEADGCQLVKRTPSGARYALDREVLESVIAQNQHPLAEVVLQRRRLLKLVSTYLDNFIELAVNGRLHPGFNTLKDEDSGYGTRTGRQVVTKPPLQTLPRKNNSTPQAIVVRNCITAGEGHQLIMCDFSQIEMRMLAHFADDPGLIAAFGEGDFFINMARQIWSDPTIEKSDARRQPTKNGAYAKAYGAGVEKFAVTAGITVEAGHAFMNQLDATYPGIRRFQREVESVARQRLETEGVAYVRSPLTNRRHIADSGKEYVLVNYLIQGTAAEVFKLKNVELAAQGLEDRMILNVHDEVILDVEDDDVEEVAQLVGRTMRDDKLFKVPLDADVSMAFRWGESTK